MSKESLISRTLAAVSRNLLTQIGAALTLVTGVIMITLVAIQFVVLEGHPYIGIITYMVLPSCLMAGLGLIGLGLLRARRAGKGVALPVIDFNSERTRRRLLTLLIFLCVFVVVFTAGTTKAIEFMESNEFCGEVCHTVMSPEYTAFQDSPHASLHCVECHVGPGAGRFLKSKLNGAGQLAGVLLGTYDQPIPTPVHNLPPTEITCEKCHWPGRHIGTVPRVITRYAEDEQNTVTRTVLQLKVGGGGLGFGRSHGIHWHNDPNISIRFRSDDSRERIHEVELTRADGTVTRYMAQSQNGSGDDTTWHAMQCTDCHTRPAHAFYGAGESIDIGLERGLIASDLPFIRREGDRAIRVPYDSHEAARRGITADIAAYYRDEHAEVAATRAADIENAGQVLGDIYARNVYPSMKIDWDTYADHSGHNGSTGCFRCHSGDHVSAGGEAISVDCRVCHDIVAWDDASPQLRELVEAPVGRITLPSP